MQCKSAISSAISRHMDTLRSRELWLLQQVDHLYDAKDVMLRTQEADLHRGLVDPRYML
jgi:hypothetical protein